MSDARAILARARDYPYTIPGRSFVWRGGAVGDFDPAACDGRTPVLAVGSNQSPDQLARKFGPGDVIPVQRAVLDGFDVCYSAHVTRYGAIAAMLQRAPGTAVSLFVTWLDDRQLEIMHETEISAANYRFAELEGIALKLEGGPVMGSVALYVSTRGHLMHAGNAVALRAIPATGRVWPASLTGEVLEIVRRRVTPEHEPDSFVLKLVNDEGFRRACTDAIAADAVPFDYSGR